MFNIKILNLKNNNEFDYSFLTQQKKPIRDFDTNKQLRYYIDLIAADMDGCIDLHQLYATDTLFSEDLLSVKQINVYAALNSVVLRLIHTNNYHELCDFLSYIFSNYKIGYESASWLYFICEYASKYISKIYYERDINNIIINLGHIALACMIIILEDNKSILETTSESLINALASYHNLGDEFISSMLSFRHEIEIHGFKIYEDK